MNTPKIVYDVCALCENEHALVLINKGIQSNTDGVSIEWRELFCYTSEKTFISITDLQESVGTVVDILYADNVICDTRREITSNISSNDIDWEHFSEKESE